MAKDYDSSPTSQGISYEIGFTDLVSEGLDAIQKNFWNTAELMDNMVDGVDKSADNVYDVSNKFVDAIDGIKSSVESPMEPLNLKVEDIDLPGVNGIDGIIDSFKGIEPPEPPEVVPPEPPRPNPLSPENDGGKGMKEMIKGMLSLKKILPLVTKVFFAFKALMPIMEMVGFFTEMLMMPFEELIFNLSMSMIPIVNKLSDVMYTLGDKIIPIVTGVINKLVPVISTIAEVVGDFLVNYIVPMVEWLSNVIKTFLEWEGAVPVLAGVLTAFLIPGIIAATKAIIGFTVALLANPFTWVVLGIAAVIAGIVYMVKYWDKIKETIGSVWGSIKGFFGGMSASIMGVLDTAMNIFSPTRWLGMLLDMFGVVESGLLDWMPDWMKWLFGIDDKAKISIADKGTEAAAELSKGVEKGLEGIDEASLQNSINNKTYERTGVGVSSGTHEGTYGRLKDDTVLGSVENVHGINRDNSYKDESSNNGMHSNRPQLEPIRVETTNTQEREDSRRIITNPIVSSLDKLRKDFIYALKEKDLSTIDISNEIRALGVYRG